MAEWFRKTSWTEADRVDFEKRLARSRPASRAQYLRIQAAHLAEAGEHGAALALLAELLENYDAPIHRAQALLQRAQSCDALDDVAGSLEAYRAALAAERETQNVRTRVGFEFPLFVARRNLQGAFVEALSVLESAESQATFTADRFEVAAARSLIAWSRGDADRAKTHAAIALQAAAERHSGLSRHPTVGLVRADPALLERLRALTG
ncbi:MAG TPA: hypothetical protein VMI54_08280 [Polyangiaceae bacterium]|nr:hypothetical protein [Polyangiaceae bacterium]